MKNKEIGSQEPKGSYGNTIPSRESAANKGSNSRKYQDHSPFDLKDYEDFAHAYQGERFKLSGITSSLDDGGSEDYDHFVENPDVAKKSDERPKQALKEAVLKQYNQSSKPQRNDNRKVKKKMSNFQMKTARDANSRQRKQQIYSNEDYSFDGYINQTGSSFSKNDMREPSSVIDEPSSIATTNKEYKQMLDRSQLGSLHKTPNGNYKDPHERIASYMNASDSDSLVQTSKGRVSKYELKDLDHGELSFDEKKPSKRMKVIAEKLENWETMSKSFDGVGKVVFDREDMTQINKALNMQSELKEMSESQLVAATPDDSILMKNPTLFNIMEKDKLEMVSSYRDKYPCLIPRKSVMKVKVVINLIAFKIIKSPIFEGISLFVIMANSLTLMIEDPLTSVKSDFENSLDEVFLVLYTAEMSLKILGLGFLFNKGAYLRDTWNILDFIIVFSAYLEIVLADPDQAEGEGGSGLAALRSFRVLRPLRTISGIEGLRIIVSSIISAMPLLFNTILVLMFFFIIFSIAGTQLFSGELKQRCVSLETARAHEDGDFCGIRECQQGYFCGKTNENPNFGASNFDIIFYSLLIVFQSVTLEGWSVFMVWIEKSYTTFSFLFFIPIVFIGAFFLLNLTLAVIKSQFTEEHNKKKKKRGPRKKRNQHFDEDEEGLTEEQKKDRAQQREQFQTQALSKWRMAFVLKKFARRLARKVEAKRAIKAELRRKERVTREGGEGNLFGTNGGILSPKSSQSSDAGPKIKILNEKMQQNNETIHEVDDEYRSDATILSHSPMFANQLLAKKITTVKGDNLIAPNGAKLCANTFGIQDTQEKRIANSHLTPQQLKGINNMITPEAAKSKPIYVQKQDNGHHPNQPIRNQKQSVSPDQSRNASSSPQPPATRSPTQKTTIAPNSTGDKTMKFQGMIGIISNVNGSVIQEDEDDKRFKKGKYNEINKQFKNFLPVSDTEFDDESEEETDPNIHSDTQHNRKKLQTYGSSSSEMTNARFGKQKRKGRAENTKNLNTSASSLQDPSTRIDGSARKSKRDPFGLKARAKSIPGYMNKSMRLQMKMPQKQRSGSPTQTPAVQNGLNHEKLLTSKDFQTFQRNDDQILGWRKKLIVRKGDIEFISAEEVMTRSAFRKTVEDKKTRAAQTLGPYSRFINYKAYQKKHIFKSYPPIEEEEEEEKKQDEEGEEGEQSTMGKSMNADLGLQSQSVPPEEEESANKLDEKISPFDLPFLSKLIVTGTIAVVCTPRKFLIPSKAGRVKLLDQAIQRAEKSIEEFGEESVGVMSERGDSRGDPKNASGDRSKSMKKSFSQLDGPELQMRGQSAQIATRNLSRSGMGMHLNQSHESGSQSVMKSMAAAKTTGGFKRMQTMKSKLIGGKQDKRGQRQNRERDITEEDVIKVLKKEMLKSTLFKKMGKAIEEEEGEDKFEEQQNTTEENEIEQELESEEDEVDSLFASTIKDEIENDPTDFLSRDIDCRVEIQKAKVDTVSLKHSYQDWSGQDVRPLMDPYIAGNNAEMLSEVRVWPYKIFGVYKKGRSFVKSIAKHGLFDNFMTLAVTANTVTLALDRYGIPEEEEAILNIFNDFFTYIFIAELGIKILGLGVIKYLKDKMNYLDGSVVILSIVELAFLSGSGGALSAFKTIRIFRTFRVLRVARLLRSMQSMQVIIGVIARSISSFAYLAILLILFIIIYALLGMQTYGGSMKFGPNWDDTPRTNFDHFHNAFVTCFQVLTMENWQFVMYDALRTDINKAITGAYFISWIFIGNFMLLNLFLAILLDSFVEEDEENNNDKLPLDMQQEIERKRIETLLKKEGNELIQILAPQEQGGSKKKKGGFVKVKKKKKGNDKLLNESIEINLDLLTKQMGSVKPKKPLYDGIDAEKSVFLFDKRWRFRILMYDLQKSQMFDHVIMGLIVFSSLKLIVDTYMLNSTDETWILISKSLDWFLNISFTIELVIKTIAMGFVIDDGSYLREFWNQLDAFIVFTSWIDQSFEGVDLPIIKIFRLLRTLRPLRFISHNPNLKAIVTALFESVGSIFNVTIVVLVVWLMFGILAVNMFGGKFQYCSEQEYTYSYKYACEKAGGFWLTRDSNFDSVPDAILSLFIVSNLEGWPDVMWSAVDSIDIEIGPAFDNTPIAAYFFIIFIFLGSFFFLNFFVGVIFLNFEEAQRQEKAALFMKDSEMKWVDIMKLIVKAKPDLETTNVPKSKFRKKLHAFITNGKVDAIIMVFIVLNMFSMAMQFETQTAGYTELLANVNYVFTTVFALEAFTKLIAFGKSYFKSGWNRFDFFVVISSFIDIVMGMLDAATLSIIRVGPQLARVLRVLRVTRLFRLLNKYKGLQALIQTIMFSLPSLMNVFGLLMLIYFLFAVLAVFLFGHIKEGGVVDDYVNFSNFGYAMLILIRASTGEDWNGIMYDTMRVPPLCDPEINCGSSFAWVYFVFFLMICSLVMLNLFILVILQQFDEYYFPQDNIMERFKNDLETFKKAWTFHTSKYNCIKIKDRDLVAFFQSMEPKIGLKGSEEVIVIKALVLMDLESDEEGYIYFNDLLYKAMKRSYGCPHVKNMLLADAELKTLHKLEKLKEKMAKKSRSLERTTLNTVNPFLTRMFYRMTWRSWMTVWGQYKEQRQYEQQEGFERQGSDSEDYSKNDTLMMEEQTIGELEEYNETIHEENDESGMSPTHARGLSNLFPPSEGQMGSRTINSALSMVNNLKDHRNGNGHDSDRKADESSLLMQL